MSGLHDACDKYFGTRDFYDILKIKRDANDKDIKKAYHKLSLLVHPDRVCEGEKEEATEKFKVLGRIHNILSDKAKRELYDSYGEFEDELHDAMSNWLEYWRSLFKPITIQDIINYEEGYIGSDEEKYDIKKAYMCSKGDIDVILECVPFVKYDSEERIVGRIQEMINSGEIPSYKNFTDEPKAKTNRRRRKLAKEKREAQNIQVDEEWEKEMAEKHDQRNKRMMNLISDLEAKYGSKNKKRRQSIKEQGEGSVRRTRSKK